MTAADPIDANLVLAQLRSADPQTRVKALEAVYGKEAKTMLLVVLGDEPGNAALSGPLDPVWFLQLLALVTQLASNFGLPIVLTSPPAAAAAAKQRPRILLPGQSPFMR